MRRTLSIIALAALGGGAAFAGPASASSSAPEAPGENVSASLNPRVPATPDAVSARSAQHQSSDRIQVKLAEGQKATSSDGRVSTTSASTLSSLVSSGDVTGLRPMVDKPAAELSALKAEAEQASGDEQADMSLWLVGTVGEGESMQKVLDELNADPAIEIAEAQPLPADLPVHAPSASSVAQSFVYASPDFTDRQTYRGPASEHGIEALAAHELPGGKGQNVKVADVEYEWDTQHEDLTQLARDGARIENGTPTGAYGTDHGTAVMGEIVGDENEFGVSGAAPGALPFMANAINAESGYTPGAAIALAAEQFEAGDVILLEQQLNGCGGGYAPLEVDNASYDAIKTATAKGVHVVEAAGNGNQNLDDSCYGGDQFPGGRGDSGAIIVGAGASSRGGSTPGSKMSFSTYGSRVNVHAWGEMVATTGYGDLQGGTNTLYTDSFSGTSSASPIVTSAVAIVSSVAKERGVELSTADMRSLLEETGTPQADEGSGKIGPQPNVIKAIESLGGGTE